MGKGFAHQYTYPVSASAITGTDGWRELIIAAFWCTSVKVAKPRSAMPRRVMLVPAPVYDIVSVWAIDRGVPGCTM